MGGVIDCEVHFTPNFGTTEGVFFSDGPGLWVPGGATHPLEPIKVTVEKGKIVKVEGGKEADIVRGLVETSDKGGRNDVISELGVGMNSYWTPDGSLHWEKKGLGNMHVAFGGRETRTAFYCDLSIHHGTFWVDGKKYVDDGKLLF